MNLINKFSNYLSFVKIAHTIFALPFALIGYFLAVKWMGHELHVQELILVLLCMLFARNSAMGFNRYIDREYDKSNPRTSMREIPSGLIRPKSALFFVLINSILFIITTYFLNHLVFYLSFVALFVILGYSATKRFTFLCHLILGLGLSLSPIGAFLAISGKFEILPILFSLIVLFWTGGFDIIYSLQDADFDSDFDLKSIPAFFGIKKSLVISGIIHLITTGLVIAAGFLGSFGYIYWIGGGIFILLLTYQHLIVSPTKLTKINQAFFTTNGIASILFSIFTVADLYL